MFSVKNSPAKALVTLLLLTASCVQSKEHIDRETLAIDHTRTYGAALHQNLEDARSAVRDNPDDPAPHYFLAQTYLLQNRLDEAEKEFKIILALSPRSSGAHYELARINTRRGRYDTALEQLNRAVELEPRFIQAHFALARLYEKFGDMEKAKLHQEAYLEALREMKEDEKP